MLKDYISNGWGLYFLSSLQGDCVIEESYMFLYSYKQELSCDNNDFETGEILSKPPKSHGHHGFFDKSECKLHWIIQKSY